MRGRQDHPAAWLKLGSDLNLVAKEPICTVLRDLRVLFACLLACLLACLFACCTSRVTYFGFMFLHLFPTASS